MMESVMKPLFLINSSKVEKSAGEIRYLINKLKLKYEMIEDMEYEIEKERKLNALDL